MVPSGPIKRAALLFLAAGLASLPTGAAGLVKVSTAVTNNVSCTSGVCAPTAKDAVLNVVDLENLLASQDVEVTTTGVGVQANDISVTTALSWSSASTLTLVSHRSTTIGGPVSINGSGGLTLNTGTRGALNFGKRGRVTFASISSQLTINGTSYTLVDSVKSLASAVAANPSGEFALAVDYNAGSDGTYSTVPVPTTFSGALEGLGHNISSLTIDDQSDLSVGLFYQLNSGASIRDFTLINAKMTAEAGGSLGAISAGNCGTLVNVRSVRGSLYGAEGEVGGAVVGGLIGFDGYECGGDQIIGSSSSGSVTDAGPEGTAGGLVGEMLGGSIELSQSSTSASAPYGAGGLVGELEGEGTIDQSFATGKVSVTGYTAAGGLVGTNYSGTITNTYSTGPISNAGNGGLFGGLIGVLNQEGYDDGASVSDSYSIGRVKPGASAVRGGFVGSDSDPGDLTNNYWDLDTSDVRNKSSGAGSPKNDSGITGLTTQEFQSGLPAGFDPSLWGENPKINGGLPYLRANPP